MNGSLELTRRKQTQADSDIRPESGPSRQLGADGAVTQQGPKETDTGVSRRRRRYWSHRRNETESNLKELGSKEKESGRR
jgi:hypothetical protein